MKFFNMIDDILTFKEFGYYSWQLKSKSSKKVVVFCDSCGKIRKVVKYNSNKLCKSCSQSGSRNPYKGHNLSEGELYDLYWNKKLTIKEISEYLKCSWNTISYNMKKYGIKRRSPSVYKKGSGRLNIDRKSLVKLYLVDKYSISAISRILGVGGTTLFNRLDEFGISKRTMSEIMSGCSNPAYKDGRSSLYALIHSLSEYEYWRKYILIRDNYTCQNCNKNGGYLEVHHIKPFREIFNEFIKEYDQFSPIEDKETLVRFAIKYKPFWDISNGKTLCKDCHKKTVNYAGRIISNGR